MKSFEVFKNYLLRSSFLTEFLKNVAVLKLSFGQIAFQVGKSHLKRFA